MKFINLIFLSGLLLGCTSSPEVYLAEQPIEVTNKSVGEYWEQKNETFSFSLPSIRAPKKKEKGYVKVRYLIDSNGNTFNPEIIESVPEGFWDYAGVKAITKQEFIPSEPNKSNKPVYYTQTIQFEFE